jgi:ectoine hydroxylase-related dioxygenase (phytanoyl-CoA dioxygenase family)
MTASASHNFSDAFLIAPTDDEDYVVSFAHNDKSGMRDFFDRFGFVCVRDVLSAAEIANTLDEFFNQFDAKSIDSIDAFFGRQDHVKLGLVGVSSEIDRPVQLMNRAAPAVYETFVNLLDEEHLFVDHGRMGVLRPTFWNGVEKPEWRTVDRWLHLDCNPLTNRISVASVGNAHLNHDQTKQWLPQGLIALTDARKQDGGFWCVPGSHRIAHEWARAQRAEEKRGSSLLVEADDPMRDHIQKITVRAGTLLVWNNLTFHANHPNRSERWRVVQYVRMYPIGKTPFTPLWPAKEFDQHRQILTPLARRLFGIDSWQNENDESDRDDDDDDEDIDQNVAGNAAAPTPTSWCAVQ